MGILIGMDEAGYGPNYGPLVVAATAWRVPDAEIPCTLDEGDCESTLGGTNLPSTIQPAIRNPKSAIDAAPDLYRLLRGTVVKKPSTQRIAIADSKTLYTPGNGLAQLERGLHAVLGAMRQSLGCWASLVDYSQADCDGHHKLVCWPESYRCDLPIDASLDDVTALASRLSQACQKSYIHPLLIRARLIYPGQFNELVTYHGSKGAALSHITVGLLREVIDTVGMHLPLSPVPRPLPPIHAVCDKHGGRNFYAALLQHHFSEHWIEPIHESREESRYDWGPPEARTRVAFRMNGERFLPTALASMMAKYLRELAMRAFNAFWCGHIPNLRPTAGYPKDAERFRSDIRAAQQQLKIDDHFIWRNR